MEAPSYPRSRRKAGEVDFRCVNCDRALHRTIWEEATEWDVETGKVTEYGLEIALAHCSCGAVNLVGFQPDRSGAVYWLNEKEMRGLCRCRCGCDNQAESMEDKCRFCLEYHGDSHFENQ